MFEYFLAEQRAGRTPNPDVLCNREIKFGVALRYARRLGGEWFATGHYARLVHGAAGTELLQGASIAAKDQTYFLHAVERADLRTLLMPLGETGRRARCAIAHAGRDCPSSTSRTARASVSSASGRSGISSRVSCAIEPGTDRNARRRTARARIAGLAFYTLGQREGLALGGRRGSLEEPWYVAVKDVTRNALVVVQGHDHPLLSSSELRRRRCTGWSMPATARFSCTVKVRYRQPDQAARARVCCADGTRAHRVSMCRSAP